MRRDPLRQRYDEDELAYTRRRYQAARSRALYWSGNATATGKRFSVSRHNAGPSDDHYELAMSDCDYYEGQIERLTGRRPKRYDPKQLNNDMWARLNRHLVEDEDDE